MSKNETDLAKRVIRWLMANAAFPKETFSARAIINQMCEADGLTSGELGCGKDSAPVAASDVIVCMKLLEEIPEWRPRMHEMAQYSTGWKNIAEVWDTLSELLAAEAKITPESDRSVRRARRGDPIPASAPPDYSVRVNNEVVLCDTLDEVHEATGRGWSYEVSSPTGKSVTDFAPF